MQGTQRVLPLALPDIQEQDPYILNLPTKYNGDIQLYIDSQNIRIRNMPDTSYLDQLKEVNTVLKQQNEQLQRQLQRAITLCCTYEQNLKKITFRK